MEYGLRRAIMPPATRKRKEVDVSGFADVLLEE
jgi:hypothetical protein